MPAVVQGTSWGSVDERIEEEIETACVRGDASERVRECDEEEWKEGECVLVQCC